jgi:hypothetical protein
MHKEIQVQLAIEPPALTAHLQTAYGTAVQRHVKTGMCISMMEKDRHTICVMRAYRLRF